MEKLSNNELLAISKDEWEASDLEHDLASELLAIRADAETSQNHNAGVIDRIVEQLREAGYTGTLSDMVDQACDARQFAENMSL
jgi:predicted RNA-binding protein